VQVIDHQQHRVLIRDRLQEIDHPFNDLDLKLPRSQRGHAGRVAERKQLRDRRPPLIAGTHAKPESINQRTERPGALEQVRGTTHNHHAVLASNVGQAREQRRLSDPGLTVDDGNCRRPAARHPEQIDEQLEFPVSPDQRPRGTRRHRLSIPDETTRCVGRDQCASAGVPLLLAQLVSQAGERADRRCVAKRARACRRCGSRFIDVPAVVTPLSDRPLETDPLIGDSQP
jgi:hypothetical protein